MPKTITIRLDDATYKLFRKFADLDNRAISNFMETATSRYIEEIEFVDDFEMAEINSNDALKKSLKRAHAGLKKNKRRQVA